MVQEGDNISFVPAEMVQGDLGAAVNGGQVSSLFTFLYQMYLTCNVEIDGSSPRENVMVLFFFISLLLIYSDVEFSVCSKLNFFT